MTYTQAYKEDMPEIVKLITIWPCYQGSTYINAQVIYNTSEICLNQIRPQIFCISTHGNKYVFYQNI